MSQTGQRSDIHQAYLGYALGKEYEDTEQWQKAFETLCFGAAARGRVKSYRQQDSVNLVESLIHNYNDPEWLQDKVGYSSKEPIFIVGMPRTGTTIVERILGAHSDVYAAGELRQFTLAMGRAFDAGRGPLFDPLQVKQSLSMDFKSLGEDYIASTRIRTGHTRFFTDKLPLNFLYLGLIAKALPNAKIIHLMRNPMDTCWSNFKQMFGDLFIYSYNLRDTAHYYVLYRKLMEHWHQLMPGRILDIEYETLVEDQENQTGRILEYCELPWQQACLDFHQNKDAVTTASSVQVRLPIYRSSLQHWRNFEPYLGEVKTIFDQAGIDY